MSSYYGQSSSRSLWTEHSGQQQSQIYADPLNGTEEDYYYDANDQNRLDLLKLILYDLNSAIAPREVRLMAIQAALDEFDHDDDVLHDEELDLRADHILLQKLAYAMCIDPSSDEVGYICSALEMVYRAGRTRLAQSFHEICDALLPLIVEMIRPPLTGKNSADKNKGSTAEEELISTAEEKRDLLDGENSLNNNPFMEPVDPFHEQRRFTYGDSDESSAESVQIPSGTGEYFEQMNRAKQEASNVAHTDGAESLSHAASQELVLKPIELREDAIVPVINMGGEGALESYKPVSNPRRRSLDAPADTIRRDLENADEALRRLTSESTELVPANYNGGGVAAVKSSYGGVPIESEVRTKRLSALTMASDEFAEQDEVMYLRGGGSGSVSSSDDASENVSQVNSRFDDVGDDVPLFDPSTMKADSQSSAYEDSSVYGSVLYPESSDNPFSDVSDYNQSDKKKDHEAMEEGDFDSGGGFNGSTPQIRPLGESVQVSDTYAAGYDEKEEDTYRSSVDDAKIGVSDHEDYQNDMNNSEFDAGGGFSGSTPQIRPLGESVQVTDAYSSAGHRVEVDEEENSYRPGVEDAKDYDGSEYGSEFDVGGGFSGSTPQIRPLGESVQVTDAYSSAGHKVEEEVDEEENSYRPGVEDAKDYDGSEYGSEFDVGGGFSGSTPQIRPLGESVQVTDAYNSAGHKVEEEDDDEEENSYRPGVNDAKDHDGSEFGSEFDVGGGFSGSTPQIRPLGESVQVTDTYGVSYGNEEEVSYLHRKRQSELTDDDWGSRREPELVDHQENKRPSVLTDEDWESRRQSELDEWSEKGRRQSELTGNFSADQEEYGQRLNRVEEEESHDPTFRSSGVEEDIFQFREPQKMSFRSSGVEEDIFQFREPQKMSQSIRSEAFFVPEQDDEFVCQLAIQKVLKILRYFSRVLSAMELLAQQPGLVDSLLYRMKKSPHSNDENEISARVDAIAVVVNLACAEENKIMLVYHPGLLDAVINIANHDPIEEAREHAAIVLMNLAYAEENKVHMVNQDHLLDTLVHLLSDVSPFTRRYASAALFTLACTYANTAVMTRHCDGGILEALRKVLLNDPIDEARVNAAEALFNMARNNSDDTIENMGNHPKLLASLAHSVLTDYSADVRAYSARALEWLSADIHHPMPCHGRLLKALTTASQWTKTTCIAEALKMQATLAENRKAMVQHDGLLDALATLALLDGINDDEVKTCAIAALERLSKESSTRHIMVKNEGVMTALTKATFAKDGTDDDDATEEDGTPAALLMKTALKNLAAHL